MLGDSCTLDCTWVECSCGDGITEWPEECDDGDLNGSEWSKCSKECKWKEDCGNPNPPRCGDGVVQWPETCDLGWLNGQPGSNVGTLSFDSLSITNNALSVLLITNLASPYHLLLLSAEIASLIPERTVMMERIMARAPQTVKQLVTTNAHPPALRLATPTQ